MIKTIIGIFMIPLVGWGLTLIPLPATLPPELLTTMQTGLSWLWALNQILPVDTLLFLFGIFLVVEFSESILHLIMAMLKLIKH